MPPPPTLVSLAARFQVDGRLTSLLPFGSGHINDTYCAVYEHAGKQSRFILQRVNTAIFHNPAALMRNIERVTAHIADRLADDPDRDRRVLTLIRTRDDRAWLNDAWLDDAWLDDPEASCWRMYRLIERTRAAEVVDSPRQAYEAARAFGRFQQQLADLPAPPLEETIPAFHDTPQRFAAFEHALAADVANRAASARPEIAFALARKPIAGMLLAAGLPTRVTHNDTKLNNVLLDNATGEGLCVIDLDTVMPGLSLYDFGDMVRTATSFAAEDEQNLGRVALQLPMFDALVRGYLSTAFSLLTAAEKQLLITAARVITLEQGIRFLADHLSGDTYYKVHRDHHNLDRCRTQFRLLASMEQQEEPMQRILTNAINGC